ncbi:MAG: bifunctional riboflavin kinase/FAD synthetase [Oscillospiraceae bacterium]|nr:bifunctional riboflavin kinase/FAD synthetase [Oscillospiraceae bacterium]
MTYKHRVIALGFFDGVHLGHSALIWRAIDIAEQKKLVPSVITFDTHPRNLLQSEEVVLINSPEDRAGLIQRVFGIDDIIFLHFDESTAKMPWALFVDHIYNEFGARHLVAGFDFRFGSKGEGNSELLKQKCSQLGIGCDIIPEVKLDNITSSSSYVRTLLLDGDIERANIFLGHPHMLTDLVRFGFRLGRTLGTPTINMCFQPGVLIPAHGVYATKVYLEDGSEHIGVTNIGIRPTVADSEQVTAETHILDYQGNLYGRQVRVEFHARIRPEIKFEDVNHLKAQIQKDCRSAKEYFKKKGLVN